MTRGNRAGTQWVLGLTFAAVACSPDLTGLGDAGAAGSETGGAETTGTSAATGTQGDSGMTDASGGQDTTGPGDTTGPDDTSEGSESTGTSAMCGNGNVEPGEECDDLNEDPTDGCLRDCSIPRSCAEILAVVPDARDDTHAIAPDGDLLDTWCDMTTEGGGWTLVAKINPADQDAPPETKPVGWMGMELEAAQLLTPELTMNAPLASHGSPNFTPIVVDGTVARLELIAADDFDVRVAWYKEVVAPMGLTSWFEFDDDPSRVCTNVAMTSDCSMGRIAPSGGGNSTTSFQGMDLDDFGYSGGFPIHMRLEDDSSTHSGICSSTGDTGWPDSYDDHWGNAMLIWVREPVQ